MILLIQYVKRFCELEVMIKINSNIPNLPERQKLVNAARAFAPLLDEPELSVETIDTVIEELRPVRMHIHALDYGEAPGFRPSPEN